MTQSYLKRFFLKSKNFQRTYTQKLPTLLYTFEQNLNEGDALLVTLNPDQITQDQQYLKKNNYITPSKASQIFDLITETSLKYPLKKKFLNVLKKSFLESFLQLKDYEGDKKQIVDLRAKYKGMRKNQQTEQDSKIISKKKKYQKLESDIEQKKAYDQQERNLLDEKQQDFHIQNIKEKGQTIKRKEEYTKEITINEYEKPIEQNKGFIPQPDPLSKENKIKAKKVVKPNKKQKVVKVKKQKKHIQKEEDEEDLSIKKIVAGGGFLKYNEQLCQWEKTEVGTTDFMTLLRQTIYVMLAYQGIIVREFVTSDGNYIASVCYAYEKNLKFMGQQKGFNKQCDLSMVDMLSLEPVDKKFRPLRFNNALLNKEKWQEQYWYISQKNLQQENDQLRQEIIELLNQVKIHNLPRKCNALNDKTYFYDQEREDIIQQHTLISKDTWLQYKQYLQNLKILLSNIDEQYLQRKQSLHKHFFQIDFKEEEKKISLDSQRQIQKEQIKKSQNEIKISKKMGNSEDFIVQPQKKIKQKVTYITYKKFIKHNQSLFRVLNNKLKKRLGNAYVKALLKSYRNLENDDKLLNLNNIWTQLDIKPLEPYIKFYLPSNKRRPRIKDFFDNIYKDYSRSKFLHDQFFSSVEKISILDWQVNMTIDMGEVSKAQRKLYKSFRKQDQEIIDVLQDVFFPLHDYNQLLGSDCSMQFKSLLEHKLQRSNEELQNHIKFDTKINTNAKQNELNKQQYLPAQQKLLYDFQRKIRANFSKDEIKRKEEEIQRKTNHEQRQLSQRIVKNPKSQYKNIKKNKMKLTKQVWPISKIFYINFASWFAPWTIQSKVLINYFGEKLAMYFQFTVYFACTIIPILVIGIICWIINFIVFFFDNNTSNFTSDNIHWYQIVGTTFNWILGFSAIIWSCFFYYDWENQEKIFKIENGLSEEVVMKERMNFQNFNYERSLVDDFVNNKKTNKKKVLFKLFLTIFITLIFLGISFGISIGFFYLKNYFVNTVFKDQEDDSLVNYKHNIVNAMEVIKIILFDYLYYYIAVYLVEWIDPKYTYEFESILIGLITLFGVLNNYFMIFFIILFKDMFMECAPTTIKSSFKTTCLIEAELLFRTYIVFHFLYSILRTLFSYIKITMLSAKKRKIEKIRDKKQQFLYESQINNSQKNIEQTNLTFQEKTNASLFLDQQGEEILYNDINKKIEQQIYLEISNRSDDYDTTIIHYYQIFNQFAGLVLLSVLFSLAYLLMFVTIMIELILDRRLYFKMMRRISPYSSSTIGNWKVSLYIVGLLGILTNGYILTFEYSKWFLDEDHAQARIFMLISFILVGLLIWLIGQNRKSSLSKKYKIMQARQNFIIQNIKNNQREKNLENETAKVKMGIQPWGEIDYDYFLKLKERKKKKILKIK